MELFSSRLWPRSLLSFVLLCFHSSLNPGGAPTPTPSPSHITSWSWPLRCVWSFSSRLYLSRAHAPLRQANAPKLKSGEFPYGPYHQNNNVIVSDSRERWQVDWKGWRTLKEMRKERNDRWEEEEEDKMRPKAEMCLSRAGEELKETLEEEEYEVRRLREKERN